MKSSFSIYPILRLDKAPRNNGKHPLYLLIRLNKQLVKISIGKELCPKHWDKQKRKVIGGGDSQVLNALLEQKQTSFRHYMYKMETMETEVTRTHVKDFFSSKGKRKPFFEFWEQQVMLWEGIKKHSTLENYRKTLMILKLFKPTMNYGDLKFDFVEHFDQYLRTKRKNTDGGVFNRHKCLKAMIKIAIQKDLMEKNPYSLFTFKPAIGKRMHLELPELQKLMNSTFEFNNPLFEQIKNMFLFSCFTGLRFSDIINLKWSDINLNTSVLQINTFKTGKIQGMSLIKPAVEIIKKYKKKDAIQVGTIFKPLTNQFVNRSLKTIVSLTGIQKRITFHCARHTFACVHTQTNTHMLVLKDLLGHSSIVQTEIYAKSLNPQMETAMKSFEAGILNNQNKNRKQLRA